MPLMEGRQTEAMHLFFLDQVGSPDQQDHRGACQECQFPGSVQSNSASNSGRASCALQPSSCPDGLSLGDPAPVLPEHLHDTQQPLPHSGLPQSHRYRPALWCLHPRSSQWKEARNSLKLRISWEKVRHLGEPRVQGSPTAPVMALR